MTPVFDALYDCWQWEYQDIVNPPQISNLHRTFITIIQPQTTAQFSWKTFAPVLEPVKVSVPVFSTIQAKPVGYLGDPPLRSFSNAKLLPTFPGPSHFNAVELSLCGFEGKSNYQGKKVLKGHPEISLGGVPSLPVQDLEVEIWDFDYINLHLTGFSPPLLHFSLDGKKHIIPHSGYMVQTKYSIDVDDGYDTTDWGKAIVVKKISSGNQIAITDLIVKPFDDGYRIICYSEETGKSFDCKLHKAIFNAEIK